MRNVLSEDVGVDGDDMGMRGADMEEDMPIADLFPEATVMFADIAGFTAWCSVREPAQVFTLLEKIYGAFDRIARLHQMERILVPRNVTCLRGR
jgi:class 3 adenylate cyclase